MGATNLGSVGKANGSGVPDRRSFPEVEKGEAIWRAAAQRVNANEEKIKRAREDKDKPPASIEERAQASLRGEAPPSSKNPDLAALVAEREVLAAAVRIAKDSLDEAIGAASVEVCRRFFPEYQERVKKTAAAAIVLQEAMDAEENLRQEIRAKGFKVTPPIEQFPRLQMIPLGKPSDQYSRLGYFLKELRAKGLEV